MMRIGRAARALLPCLLALSGPAPARAQELETVWLRASGGTVYLIYPEGHAVPSL